MCMFRRSSATFAKVPLLDASRMSPSSFARSASAAPRSSDLRCCSRARALPKLRLHMTPVATRTKPTRIRATRERPRTSLPPIRRTLPPSAKMGAAGARVARDFVRTGVHGLAGEQLAERATPTAADRLPGRAHAGQTPRTKRVLHDPVLPRVVGDHREDARGHQPLTERRKRPLERIELAVHRDTERLEQSRKVGRSRPRPEHRADGADEVVAGDERPVSTTPADLASQTAAFGLIAVVLEDRGQFVLVR